MSTWIILTSWVGTGTFQDPYTPKVVLDHAIASWTSLDSEPPRPGGPAQIKATISQDVLQQIQCDSTYQGKVFQSE